MLAIARFAIMGFLVLSVVYVSVWLYLRACQREKIEAMWTQDGPKSERDRFVDARLVAYDTALRRKLIPLVYGVPVCVVMVIIYLTNSQ